jgi:apolipoprotein N-acyltransferase
MTTASTDGDTTPVTSIAASAAPGVLARPGVALAAAGSSGVLLALAAPPVGVGWLAWVALVPAAAVAIRHAGTPLGRAAVPFAVAVYLELLLIPALPFGVADRQWGEPPLPIMVGDSPVVAASLVAIPLAAILLYAIDFPFLGTPRHGVWVVLVPALVWTAFDLLRTKFDPSGLFGPLFLSQADLPAARLATLAGPWLLTFAVVGVGFGLASVSVPLRVGLVVGVAAALAGAGGVGAATPGPVRVAVVQPGYDTSEFERPVLHWLRRANRNLPRASRAMIGDLAPLTLEAGRRGAELVVWPEAALWVDPHGDTTTRRALERLAAEARTAIVVPYFLRGPDNGATAIVLPAGTVTGPQPKQRPMWFLGEHGSNRIPPRPVGTSVGAVGTMLGVDNQDAAVARRLAAAGATLLVSSTHDWKQLAAQQRAFTRLHAVAVGRPVLRSDWRNGSFVVDRDGRVAADAGLATRRTLLVAEVVPGAGRTLYLRIGDVFGWLAVAAALAAAGAGLLRRRATAG